jgi:hypothetical protein
LYRQTIKRQHWRLFEETSVKKIITTILILLIGIACASTLQAQREKPYEFGDLDIVWTNNESSDHNFSFIKLPAADQSIAVRKREAVLEILKNSSVFSSLKGVALRTNKEVMGQYDSEEHPNSKGPVDMIVGMTIGKFIRIVKMGRIEPFFTEMPRIEIYINYNQRTPPTWDANKFWYEGLEFYLEPHVTAKTDGGLSIYRLDAWFEEVVVTNGKPLWIPATSEQFLRAMITYARDLAAKENENSRSAGRPSNPDEQSLYAQFVRGYEKELAALSPAERQQPAYYLRSNDNPMLSGLVKANTLWARLVVTPNLDYFNRSLPRTAIQLILCLYNYNEPYGSDEAEKPDLSLKTLNNLARHLEYEKLAALIEK